MLEINAFEILLEILKKYDNGQYLAKSKKKVDSSYLHNNHCLIEFYSRFELKNLVIETGISSLSFIDYFNLQERNTNYSFSNLKKHDYLIFLEQTGGGEPILFNFQEDNNNPSIYAAYDVLEPFKIADNFLQFIEALTVIVDTVYNEYNIYETYTNDDCDEIKPEFLPKIKMKLSPILGENIDSFMKYFYE
ncbi:SMI1/KNR4 family protein [Snodgrassella alvi]|uniref:SMI1/KNR4 family protein n=1 Tax=Snodgrassella alvi TaxID=1196083 RepID=UPI00351A47E5